MNNYIVTDENTCLVHAAIDNIDLSFDVLQRIFPCDRIRKELMMYDLLHHKGDPKSSIDEIIDFTTTTLKKYQYEVGGYDLEDNAWILCESDNHRFRVHDKKIIYNSVPIKHDKCELKKFMNNIINYVTRHVIDNACKINYKLIEDEGLCVSWVIISFSQNTQNTQKS